MRLQTEVHDIESSANHDINRSDISAWTSYKNKRMLNRIWRGNALTMLMVVSRDDNNVRFIEQHDKQLHLPSSGEYDVCLRHTSNGPVPANSQAQWDLWCAHRQAKRPRLLLLDGPTAQYRPID